MKNNTKKNNQSSEEEIPLRTWQKKIHIVVFGTDTPAGKAFDVALLWAILLSIFTVMLESVSSIQKDYGHILRIIEWFFTILFSIEYIARLISVRKPFKYIFSFYGLVDIISILPTYLSLFIAGSHYLLIIRTLRLLRIFRIFKLVRFIGEADILKSALVASSHKIIVFFVSVLSMVMISGTIMYLIEGPENGFTSIPTSIYWAIVTLTTVGYGDISPHTTLGQFFASFIMILGYAIIAVPTGIVTAEIASANRRSYNIPSCPGCGNDIHDGDANFCKKCGTELP